MLLTGVVKRLKRVLSPPAPSASIYPGLPAGASVLDLGCSGFVQYSLAREMGRSDLHHCGVDCFDRSRTAPAGYDFRMLDLDSTPLPFQDDTFDLVVASHVLEHLSNTIPVVGEAIRVCKPGGLLYIAAPSERSLLAPGMFFAHGQSCSLSFFDDPTHRGRPWTPQALHRLARDYGCEPVRVGYRISWACRMLFPLLAACALAARRPVALQRLWWLAVGWEAFGIIRKDRRARGRVDFEYFSPQVRRDVGEPQ